MHSLSLYRVGASLALSFCNSTRWGGGSRDVHWAHSIIISRLGKLMIRVSVIYRSHRGGMATREMHRGGGRVTHVMQEKGRSLV